jgi:hypothetical protein
MNKRVPNLDCLKLIYNAINRPFSPGKIKLESKKNRDKISEIRIEEIHDVEETKVYWRVYYTVNERIVILGESEVNPELARYRSKYL